MDAARSSAPPYHKSAQLDARIGDMRTNRGLRTAEPARDLFGRKIFDVAKDERGALARGQLFETRGKPVALLRPDQGSFGIFRMVMRRIGNLAESHTTVAAEEIERRIGRDAGKPVCSLLFILQLILTLESFDESLLRKVLRIVHITDNSINLKENPTEMLGNETFFKFEGRCSGRSLGTREILVHQTQWRGRLHPLLK
jgi:hypothetical protein